MGIEKKAFNSEIGILRFVFAVFIFLVHVHDLTGRFFGDGNFAVEFFFFLSGYFLAVHAIEKRDRTLSTGEACRNYLSRRYLTLLPLLLIAILFGAVTRLIINGALTKAEILHSLGDVFLTQGYRFQGAFFTGVTWYLSVLMIGIALLYPLLVKWPSYFTNVFSIVFALFAYGTLAAVTGNLSDPGSSVGFLMKGTLRGLAAMSIGCFLYGTMPRLSKIRMLQHGFFRNVIKWSCYLVVFAGMTFLTDSPYLFPLLLPFAVATGLSLYEGKLKTKSGGKFETFARFLQDLSLPFYLLHWNVIALTRRFAGQFLAPLPDKVRNLLTVGLAFLLSLAAASLFLLVEKAVKKAWKKRKKSSEPAK